MRQYPFDKKRFYRSPSPIAAGDLIASAMKASGDGEITDAELIETVLAVRDFLYKAIHPKSSLS